MNPEDTDLAPEVEARLRRGLTLLAAEAPEVATRPPASRRLAVIAVSSAAAALAVLLAFQLTADTSRPAEIAGPSDSAVSPPESPLVNPPIAQGVTYDLRRLVSESERIVVGTIGEVRQGTASEDSGGLDYVLATVVVEETIRGPRSAEVVAFDYSYGNAISTGPTLGARLVPGERVLLFLASTAGTVNASIRPEHWQVTGGGQGEFTMRGSDPDAPFTLAQVRQEAAATKPPA
ncbi:hypothetical protein [Sporichthya sp.]|uniref:hypothetical protein n=1 Tax=Sporichthya sp. TaxID=65475 RepID=UPI00181327B0|nr:hypothetical protein [Sporichthya sp.]MBA3742026.1 hypothetical protein [Sporichthya sp.]